jgi:uncharacterized protein (DUF58 family)
VIARLLSDPRIANRIYGFTPPESGTIVLSHRRVYIVPARIGFIFGITLVILLIGSINYAISLGFALTFLLAGVGVAGMVHTVRNLGRLYLENDARFERIAVLARHLGGGTQQVFDVPAQAIAEVVLAAPAAKRGWLPLGRVMLETRFPVGLFRAWSYVEPEARGLVYPQPESSPLPALAADASAGQARASAPGNDDFSGLRVYQRSDSPRHVAWKAVARTEEMLTKQFHGEAAAQLWLDWASLAPSLDVETRLSRLTGWVLAAEASGALYGLRLPGTEIAPNRGDAHCATCLQTLALYEIPSARP